MLYEVIYRRSTEAADAHNKDPCIFAHLGAIYFELSFILSISRLSEQCYALNGPHLGLGFPAYWLAKFHDLWSRLRSEESTVIIGSVLCSGFRAISYIRSAILRARVEFVPIFLCTM